jgi:hypothetical protein
MNKTLNAERGADSQQRMVRRFIRMFKCDTARITSPCGTHYLILGWTKNTKTEREAGRDAGQWHRNGEPIDFDYTHEQVVARGKTVAELVASAKHYKKLLGMTRDDYLRSPNDPGERIAADKPKL